MKNASQLLTRLTLLLAWAALGGCSLFDQPTLPRPARIDTADTRIPADELRQVVARADILYLPADRLESDEQSGAALRLLNLLQQSTARAALAWGNVAADLQPLFQEWNSGRMALDIFIDWIRFGSGTQRDAVRRLLRESRERELASLPVACPGGLSCTAENVAREFSALGGGKLLVVVNRGDLDASSGIPFYLARRLHVRQVVFDPRPKTNPALLAGATGTPDIVNAAPRAGRDRL